MSVILSADRLLASNVGNVSLFFLYAVFLHLHHSKFPMEAMSLYVFFPYLTLLTKKEKWQIKEFVWFFAEFASFFFKIYNLNLKCPIKYQNTGKCVVKNNEWLNENEWTTCCLQS